MGAITQPEPIAPPPPGTGARPARIFLDPLLWLCALALIAFPVACVVAASRAPVDPRPAPRPRPFVAQGPTVRTVPVIAGTAGPAAVRERVEAEIDRVFDRRDAARMRGYLQAGLPAPAGTATAYPYRYRGLSALVGRTPPAGELGALLILASTTGAYVNADQVAFALLDRARGTCDAQLNLAFLVAASVEPGNGERELREAIRACPGDPTAAWLLGQWQSLNDGDAVATFRALQRRLPRASAGWAGEADEQLRLAHSDGESRFLARSRYRRALALYRRARTLDRDPGLAAGEARALAGLGEHARAARLSDAAARALGRPASVQVQLVGELEHAHDYAAATREAARLAADPRFPHGPGLFFAADHADLPEPLSLGAGRLQAAGFEIRPIGQPVHDVESGGVEALPFLPTYREDELARDVPRCAAWSAQRDLVLAGRPLAPLPARFSSIDGEICAGGEGVALLAAVGAAEAGDEAGAAVRLSETLGVSEERAGAAIAERRQNLWRFAGRYDRAAAIADRTIAEFPGSIRAFERAGEIAYLRGRHEEAARRFATAVSLARERYGTWSGTEAVNLMRRGAVLRFAGRYEAALATLLEADEVATRGIVAASDREPYWAQRPPRGIPVEKLAIDARAQTGDTYLRMGRFADADERYDAARSLAKRASYVSRPAVDNNQALAKLHLGQAAAAIPLARAAVASDPRNPLFLETLGSAFAHAGDHRRAASTDWHAVRQDPTLFTAWNDLGVVLARSGRHDAAVSALRRAVGVREGYALAWFNLGVVLEDGGPREAAAAQGAFARAARYDAKLAGRKHALVLDDRVYFSGLDITKPIPPKWSFADSQPRWPVPAAGLALALLLGVQLARAAAGRGLPGGSQRWLETARDLLGRLPRALVGLGSAAAAIIVTVAVLVWPAWRAGDRSFATLAPLLAGLLLVIAMVARVRILAARQAGVALRQRSWRPALFVAVAGAALGAPLAPLPVAETERPAPLVHQAGPLVAAAIGLVLAILGAWSHVPATQAVGTAAIVMAASMLIPVAPLDGARLGGGGATAAGFGLVGVAILALVGLG